MKKSFRKRITTLLKGGWHILVIILLLSLPTFSFFMPGFELSDLAIFSRNNDDSTASGSSAGLSKPGEGDTGNEISSGVGFTRSGIRPSGRSGITGSDQARKTRRGNSGQERIDRRGLISREGLDVTGRDSGEDGTRGDSETGASEILEDVLKELESLDAAVKALSSGYGNRGYSGSGSSRNINPFLRSLANTAGEGDGNGGDSGGDSGGDTGGGDTGGGDTGGGDTGGGSSGDDDQNINPEERIHNALLIGSFQEDQESTILQASRGDSELKFYLDDGTSVDLFYSGIGMTPGVIKDYSENEIILTNDFNGDGLEDLLVVTRGEYGDVVNCWARVMENQIQEAFSGSFPYLTISGLDFFDWDSDGVNELVVAFENTQNLFIYDINNETLRYSREFTLPFEPSAVVSTSSLVPFKTSYLHVGNDSLDQNVLFNSRYPGVYSFMPPATLKSSSAMELERTGLEGDTLGFLAVEYDDRLLVLRTQNDYYMIVCSLGLRNSSPIASIVEADEGGYLKIFLGF